MSETAQVVSRAALKERAATLKAWQFEANLFGPGEGAYIRGYSQDELDQWRELATDRRGRIDPSLLNAAEIAFCVAEDADGTLLFRNPDAPTGLPARGDIEAIRAGEVPPGVAGRIVLAIDRRAGFDRGDEDPTSSLNGSNPSPASSSSDGASTASDAGPAKSPPRPAGSGKPLSET